MDLIFAELGGTSFGNGLYRVNNAAEAVDATGEANEFFGEHRGRFQCFGTDWLGRRFAVDRDRIDGNQHLVAMLEPGTGEVLEVPATARTFHEEELIAYGEAALASGFYEAWRNHASDRVPLRSDECVGYEVPLFLGGTDAVANLARQDLSVYWSICAQLRAETLTLPLGSTVSELRIRP